METRTTGKFSRSNGSYSVSDDIIDTLLSRWFNLTTTLPTSSYDLVAYFNKSLKEDGKTPLSHYSMSALVSHGELSDGFSDPAKMRN